MTKNGMQFKSVAEALLNDLEKELIKPERDPLLWGSMGINNSRMYYNNGVRDTIRRIKENLARNP